MEISGVSGAYLRSELTDEELDSGIKELRAQLFL